MEDLILGLQILLKYSKETRWPTYCERDCLHIIVDPEQVPEEDIQKLKKLGFHHDDDHFYSFRFGSC